MAGSTNVNKVSIVCLTYNHAPYIRECLDSMLMQNTNFPFEIIVHDDASTDGTTEIVRDYAKKYPNIIKPIIQIQNQYSLHGSFKPIMANCFNNCTGEYIAMCEGDDYWLDSKKLQKQFDLIRFNNGIALTFHNAKVIDIVNGEEYAFVNHLQQGNVPYWKLILKSWCTPTASFFFRKSCIADLYQLDDINGDMFILFGCGIKGKIYYLDEILSVYRFGTPGSASDTVIKTSKIPVYKKKIALMKFINRISHYRYVCITSIKMVWCKLQIIKCKLLGR